MSSRQNDTARRKLLKSIGATGLALGTMGVASAGGNSNEDVASTDDEVSPEGYWEYTCSQELCASGARAEYRRYCADGSCSGWEPTGNCC